MSEFVNEFNDDNFTEEVLQSQVPVLVDFWAEWCGPCRTLNPVIEEISKEYQTKIKCGKVNVDKSPSTASSYGIRSIPSILFFNGGQISDQLVGSVPKNQITDILDGLTK